MHRVKLSWAPSVFSCAVFVQLIYVGFFGHVFELDQEARSAEYERLLEHIVDEDENASKRPRVGTAGLNMDGPIFGTGEVCDVCSVLDLEQLSVF